MNNLLTEGNLQVGIKYWREQKKNWPADFHNAYYKYLRQLKGNGLTEEWWESMVHELRGWQASRGKGKTDAYIRERGLERLGQLKEEQEKILRANHHQEPNLRTVTWVQIRGLFSIASSIKNVDSPVFGSKLCHFILPDVFPIIDQEVTGVESNNYADYWSYCSSSWSGCQLQQELIALLSASIGDEVIEQYPWSTKVTELCVIGSRHRTT